jgi:hypothetical protein
MGAAADYHPIVRNARRGSCSTSDTSSANRAVATVGPVLARCARVALKGHPTPYPSPPLRTRIRACGLPPLLAVGNTEKIRPDRERVSRIWASSNPASPTPSRPRRRRSCKAGTMTSSPLVVWQTGSLRRNFWCSIPPWRIVVHAAVTHVHACHSACNFDPLSGLHPLGWTGVMPFNWPSAGRVPLQT